MYFGYPLTVKPEAPFQREELVVHLERGGVETGPIMAGNITEQPVMRSMSYRVVGELENSKLIKRRFFLSGNHNGIGMTERGTSPIASSGS